MRRLSSTSDEIILNFASSVDGFSRIQQSTGSDIRDRCRDLLAKALKKGSDESKQEVMELVMHHISFFLFSQHCGGNTVFQSCGTN